MLSSRAAVPAEPGLRAVPEHTGTFALKQVVRTLAVPTARLRPLPDFLIIGAQRCGTTSLYKYLAEHPGFCSATMRTKGVHFFDMRYEKGIDWYRAHFPTVAYRAWWKSRRGAEMVTGEASPYYFFHPHVPYRLAQHMPHVKLIVMLRDPIERTYSQWQHELSRGFESARTFEEALEREPARLAGELAKMNADPDYKSYAHQHHAYVARSRYADQLETYRSLFPSGQILAVKAEDFFSDPGLEYARVCEFLRLPAHDLGEYKKHNGYKRTAMDPATRAGLEEAFADSGDRLVAMLGPRFSWS